MPHLQPTRTKPLADHQLERRVALALLSARIAKLRFLHVHVAPCRSLRLVLSRNQLLEVAASGGRVTLGGVLAERSDREQLKALVKHIPGVIEVIDAFDTRCAPKVIARIIGRPGSAGFDAGSAVAQALLSAAG